MNKKSNKNNESIGLNKVEEPTLEYNLGEKMHSNIEDHPLFKNVIEKAIKEADEGKLIPHAEVMRRMKEKFPFLK